MARTTSPLGQSDSEAQVRTDETVRIPDVGDEERLFCAVCGGALALYGVLRRSPGGIVLALLGCGLLMRGATGRSRIYRTLEVSTAPRGRQASRRALAEGGVLVERSVTIDRPPLELWRFWRDLENLPRFMHHLRSVKRLGGGRSHWVVEAPLGTSVEWDAEIVEEQAGEMIAWESLEGAEVHSTGLVQFRRGPHGTQVHVSLRYNPPGGALGAGAAKILGKDPEREVEEDLRRFKQLMEAGEIPTTAGQSSCR